MRKRRRLADKMTIMVCAVLIAFSAFFYVPMDVNAEEVSYLELNALSDEEALHYSSGDVVIGQYQYYGGYLNQSTDSFDLVENIQPDLYYEVDLSFIVNVSINDLGLSNDFLSLYSTVFSYGNLKFAHSGSKVIYDSLQYVFDSTLVAKGSDLNNNSFNIQSYVLAYYSNLRAVNVDWDYTVNSVTTLSNTDSDEYQNGYNAGYSAGQSDGYNNGYSDGFLEGEESGFQAGVDSVDTQSYYDAGYDAGYNQAYSVGYNNGFNAGRDSVMLSKGQWGESVFLGDALNYNLSGNPFYVSSYGLIDMEEYQSGQNGYFYNTVPGTFSGYSDYNFTIPFSTLNNGTMFRIDSDQFEIDFRLSNLRTYLNPNSASATLNANLYNSKIVEAYVTYNGTKFYGQIHNNDDVDFHFQVDSFSDVNWLNDNDMSVTIKVQNNVCLVTDSDISLYVGCEYTPKLLFTLGPSSLDYAIMVRPYYGSDNVSANIQNQTDKLNENSNKNTNSIINGFNNSKGESVNSDFSAGLNEFQTAEDSLFSTASSSLSDYQFFNLSSVPAMVTGISFVSSIMTSWFNQAGGASGVGIVLSILFSIMLVAMVLGLYRWYQSKGGKD